MGGQQSRRKRSAIGARLGKLTIDHGLYDHEVYEKLGGPLSSKMHIKLGDNKTAIQKFICYLDYLFEKRVQDENERLLVQLFYNISDEIPVEITEQDGLGERVNAFKGHPRYSHWPYDSVSSFYGHFNIALEKFEELICDDPLTEEQLAARMEKKYEGTSSNSKVEAIEVVSRAEPRLSTDSSIVVTSKPTSRDNTPHILEGVVSSNPKTRSEGSEGDQLPSMFIERLEPQGRYMELRNRGVKAIVFLGSPGIGKSWLARHVVKSEDGIESLHIRMENGRPAQRDLITAFVRRGMDPSPARNEDLEGALGFLMGCLKAESVLILDDIESTDQLYGLLSVNTEATVVATCRYKMGRASADWEYIYVGRMSNKEATQMVASHLREVESDYSVNLAKSLANYPLIIRHGCERISAQSLTPDEVMFNFRPDDQIYIPDRKEFIADLVVNETGLFDIIASQVLTVRDYDIVAYRLLEVAPFLCVIQTWEFAKRYLEVNYQIEPGASCLDRALQVLRSFSLVEVQRPLQFTPSSTPLPITLLYTNRAVSQALYMIFESRRQEVMNRLRATVGYYIEEYSIDGELRVSDISPRERFILALALTQPPTGIFQPVRSMPFPAPISLKSLHKLMEEICYIAVARYQLMKG